MSFSLLVVPTQTVTTGLRGRLMGAAPRPSGSSRQQHLETASQGTASSTPQGTPDFSVLTQAEGVVFVKMSLVTFKLSFPENHLLLLCENGCVLFTTQERFLTFKTDGRRKIARKSEHK